MDACPCEFESVRLCKTVGFVEVVADPDEIDWQ